MASTADREAKLHSLVQAICATGQSDVIAAAQVMLEALVDGSVALKHMRMYPSFMAEAVRDAIEVHTQSVRPDGDKSNV